MSLLHISSSPFGDNSNSLQVSKEFIEAYKTAHPEVEVITKDLAANPVPHLDGETIAASFVGDDQRTDSQKNKNQYRLDLINELVSARDILISVPMWNWNVPSSLKAYIDQILYVGVLDTYTNKKLEGKSVTIILSSGGSYTGDAPGKERDYESGYLKMIFSSLGSENVSIIHTEFTLAGVAPGMESFVDARAASHNAAKEAAKVRASAL